ncbi:MAG: cobalt ECF transporter T component CbiQ [Oceanospirillaceae bacterium]
MLIIIAELTGLSDKYASTQLMGSSNPLQQNTFIEHIDPRARICCALLFAIVVVLSEQLLPLLIALSSAVFCAYQAKLAVKHTLKRLLAMDMFMLYLLILLPFTVPGDAFMHLFGLAASWQGLEQGVQITLKANSVILMLFSLVSNLSHSALAGALSALRVSEKLIQLLLFTLRYLTVIEQEYQKLRRAMRARAFVMKFNWHTWKSIGYLIAMMLLKSVQRSERVVKAMKCRGYNGKLNHYYVWHWQRLDSVFCVAMFGLALLITILNLLL